MTVRAEHELPRCGPEQTDRETALSPAEERLLFLDRLHPGSAQYSVPVRYRFRGALDADALRAALQELVTRHEALRTYVTADDRRLTKRAATLPWSVLDLSTEEPAAAAAMARRHIDAQARRPVSTATAPLARACLVREPEDRWTLLVTLHHLIADQYSMNLLDRELQQCYGSRAGLTVAVPPPPRCGTGRRDPAASLRYWRGELAGLCGRIPLPADRPRPDVVSPSGDVVSARLDEAFTTRLAGLAADCCATEFMVLLAGYAAFLGHVAGPEVVIGVPFYGRTAGEERIVGMFVNVLPIRVRADGKGSFRDLVGRVRKLVTGALAHQHVPLQDLVTEVSRTTRPGDHPLTQVSFTHVDDRRWRWAPAGATAIRDVLATGTAKYELLWTVTAGRDSSTSDLEFSTDLFGRDRAEELHGRLLKTLAELGAAPDVPVGTVLTGTAVATPPTPRPTARPGREPAHEQVARQARAHPAAVAIRDGEHSVSYGELDSTASALADVLVDRGVRPGERVAVAVGRGADAVTAFLAVLRAGAAYVPIDTTQPPARSHLLMRDSRVRFALCEPENARHAPPGVRVVALAEAAGHPGSARRIPVTDRHPAYVMYTSGSTGTPKGVVVPHRAISRLVPDSNYIRFRADDVVAHVSNTAFDAATFEIWGALCAGATLAVVPRDVALSPREMSRFLRQAGVTVMFVTPTLLNATVAHAADAYAGLRVLLFGGEQYAVEPIRRLLAAGAPRTLLNAYGPTENTTFSAAHEVTGADLESGVIPIGTAIDGTYLRVLDERLSPVPPGGSGELYLGGLGLADGYTDDPCRTCATFVADPYAEQPGQRLYRTGDLVRTLPGGDVVFLGRDDDQVKLSGFRVEIGEVERALRGCPGVRDGAVLAVRGPAGLELTAVLAGPAEPREAREYLRARLPAYMLPGRYLKVERLPMTSNGKVDRTALLRTTSPAVGLGPPVADAGDVGDATRDDPVRTCLAEIWRDLLGITDPSPDSDFFSLGGTSIKAMHMVAALHKRFGVNLRIVTVFQQPSFADLAARINELIEPNGVADD